MFVCEEKEYFFFVFANIKLAMISLSSILTSLTKSDNPAQFCCILEMFVCNATNGETFPSRGPYRAHGTDSRERGGQRAVALLGNRQTHAEHHVAEGRQ